MIARLHGGDAGADLDHHAGALMAQDGGEQPFGVGARAGEVVGMADAGGLDLDHDLAGLRAFEIDLHDLQRLAGLKGRRRRVFSCAVLSWLVADWPWSCNFFDACGAGKPAPS